MVSHMNTTAHTADWRSVQQIADLLQQHPRTIRRWIAEGRLPASRIGREWRISAAAVTAALDSQRIGSTD